jgi:predicted NBD/HSP70 family sugar kinase
MIRIGFDIGGSKIAALALDPEGNELARARRDVPRETANSALPPVTVRAASSISLEGSMPWTCATPSCR